MLMFMFIMIVIFVSMGMIFMLFSMVVVFMFIMIFVSMGMIFMLFSMVVVFIMIVVSFSMIMTSMVFMIIMVVVDMFKMKARMVMTIMKAVTDTKMLIMSMAVMSARSSMAVSSSSLHSRHDSEPNHHCQSACKSGHAVLVELVPGEDLEEGYVEESAGRQSLEDTDDEDVLP